MSGDDRSRWFAIFEPYIDVLLRMGEEDLGEWLSSFPPYLDAFSALDDGDLQPLLQYLRSGFPIDTDLRMKIAAHIEGATGCDFLIVMKGRNRGQRARSEVNRRQQDDVNIGLYILWRMHQDPSLFYDAVVAEAAEKFSAGKTRVTAALALVRKILASLSQDGIPLDFNLLPLGNSGH